MKLNLGEKNSKYSVVLVIRVSASPVGARIFLHRKDPFPFICIVKVLFSQNKNLFAAIPEDVLRGNPTIQTLLPPNPHRVYSKIVSGHSGWSSDYMMPL